MSRVARIFALALAVAALGSPAAAGEAGGAVDDGQIVFSTGFDGTDPGLTSQIFSVDPDGGGRRQLTHLPKGRHAVAPDASPDGDKVVYQSDASGDWQIWVMQIDGTDQHRLFADPGFSDRDPSWSPNGTRVVFARCRRPRQSEYCDIDVVRADGSNRRRVLGGNWEHHNPRFSPDGSRIAFSSTMGGFRSAVWVVRADGTNVRRITSPTLLAFVPDWAPDGAHIVFSSHCCVSGSNAYIVRPDGTELQRVTNAGPRHNFAFARYSPDGSRLVLSSDAHYPNADGVDLLTMKTDGTDRVRLTHSPPTILFADWAAA
jgi:Tol biopolymer transport system component